VRRKEKDGREISFLNLLEGGGKKREMSVRPIRFAEGLKKKKRGEKKPGYLVFFPSHSFSTRKEERKKKKKREKTMASLSVGLGQGGKYLTRWGRRGRSTSSGAPV